MPTENEKIGILYIADNDGNYHEFGGIKEIKEINIELDERVDVMEMDFSLTDEITIPITLSRKSKKICGKILMMPKYVITEWCFPRKKKRGTMRRNRRKGGDTE